MYARRIASWMEKLPADVRGIFNEDAAARWEAAGDDVPASLVTTSVAATTQEEVTTLTQSFRADREGYAHTRHGAPEEHANDDEDDAIAAEEAAIIDAVREGNDSDDEETPAARRARLARQRAVEARSQGRTFLDRCPDEFELEMPTNASNDTTQVLHKEATRILNRASGGSVVMASSATTSQIMSDYHPYWFVLTFPHLFMHGCGAVPSGMALDMYIQTLLRRGYPFASSPAFTLTAFNVVQRHRVNTSAWVTTNNDNRVDLRTALAGASDADIRQAAELMSSGATGWHLSKRLAAASDVVKALVRSFKVTAGRVLGSPHAFASLRSRTIAMWHFSSQWTMSFTFNPSELNAPIMFELAGHKFTFDEQTPQGLPVGRPTMSDRWRIVAQHCVANATYMRLFLDAVQTELFGWPAGAKRQANPNALFGRITSFFWKLESSGRGGIHAHGNISQPDLQPTRLKGYLCSPEFQQRLFDFIDGMASQVQPSTLVDGAPTPFARDSQHETANLPPLPDGVYASTCRPPLEGPNATDHNHNRHVAYCVAELNTHAHTYTCSKNGFQGGDDDCRMGYPKPKVAATAATPEGYVAIRRDDPMIVPYTPALFLGDPCNHAVYFMCEASDYLREVEEWEKKKARGETTGERPTALPLHVVAARKAEYSSKYNTKTDGVGVNTKFVTVAQHLDTLRTEPTGAPPAPPAHPSASESGPTTADPAGSVAGFDDAAQVDEARRAAKRAIAKVVNQVNGTVTYCAALASYYLLYKEDSRCSHTFRTYNHASFTNDLLARVGMTQLLKSGTHSGSISRGTHSAVFVSDVDDYRHRGASLASLSPYVVNMKFVKVKALHTTEDEDLEEELNNPLGRDETIDYDDLDGQAGTAQEPTSTEKAPKRRGRKPLPRYMFSDDHPQGSDYAYRPREEYVLNQFFSDPPPRPCEQAPWDDKQLYAAFVLANFTSDRDKWVRQALADMAAGAAAVDLWALFKEWEGADTSLHARLCKHFLTNINDHTAARQHNKERAILRREQLKGAALDECGDPMEEDEDGPFRTTRRHAHDDEGDGLDTHGLSTNQLDGLMSRLLQAPHDGPVSSRAAYMSGALRPFQGIKPARVGPNFPGSAPTAVVKGTRWVLTSLNTSLARIDLKTRQKSAFVAPTADASLTVLRVDGVVAGARLDVLDATSPEGVAVRETKTFGLGQKLPHVKVVGDPPTLDDTIQLFTLSEDQALAFGRLATALLEEAFGRRPRGFEPIRAWVTGGPGCGKSQLLTAFEWFAFQHDKLHWIGKCSYTWRAASNISTPDNVAISTSRFFRINSRGGHKPYPDQADTITRFRDVRFILCDEFSFTDIKHFNVRCLRC